jgi:hypothetical protein
VYRIRPKLIVNKKACEIFYNFKREYNFLFLKIFTQRITISLSLLRTKTMSSKDDIHYDYLIYGSTGFFGKVLVKCLEDAGCNFVCGHARLEDRAALSAEIDKFTPNRVISAAGLAGTPNIVRRLFSVFLLLFKNKTLELSWLVPLSLFLSCHNIRYIFIVYRVNRIGLRLINPRESVRMSSVP